MKVKDLKLFDLFFNTCGNKTFVYRIKTMKSGRRVVFLISETGTTWEMDDSCSAVTYVPIEYGSIISKIEDRVKFLTKLVDQMNTRDGCNTKITKELISILLIEKTVLDQYYYVRDCPTVVSTSSLDISSNDYCITSDIAFRQRQEVWQAATEEEMQRKEEVINDWDKEWDKATLTRQFLLRKGVSFEKWNSFEQWKKNQNEHNRIYLII